ncbi:hypothetical protein [Secundilactobacillus folii]|uniref:Uncharacterized protein n=1 Tax=Secundilactobacillus folii TaxID=2678357 RepID=A0A7X2XV98_9LACO|nr:hypothetical protein [Secundilactobacillus folii]MTV82175.1 hypothetical protein [Secundilactobacillus folii]
MARYTTWVQAPQGNSAKISYVDKSTGKEVGTGSVAFDKSATITNVTTTSNLSNIISGVPSGYVSYDNDNGGAASVADRTAAASVKNGDTVDYVKATDASATKAIKVSAVDQSGNPISLKSNDKSLLDASGAKAAFQVKAGDTVSGADVANIISDANLSNLISNYSSSYMFDKAADTSTTAGNAVDVKATFRLIAYLWGSSSKLIIFDAST